MICCPLAVLLLSSFCPLLFLFCFCLCLSESRREKGVGLTGGEVEESVKVGGALCFFGNHMGKINMARDMGDPTKGRFAMKGGWLTKRGHKVKNWKRRWFSLRGNSIHYYKNPRVRPPPFPSFFP